MFEKFTDKARKVMSLAQDEARSLGQMYVGTEHLLLALIREGEGIAAQALEKLDISYDEALTTVRDLTPSETEPVPGGHIPFTPRAKRVLEGAYRETMTHGQTYISTEHLLLGIVSEGNGRAMDALRQMGVSADAVRNAVNELMAKQPSEGAQPATADVRMAGFGPGPQQGGEEGSVLEQYGRNLTKLAADGKLDPVIGRDREIERVMQVLARRQKNNPLILGDPGVGKTAIVEGLAQLILRALGKPGMSVVLTVISLGTRVVLAYILSAVPAFGVVGIWWSVPIGWALADAAGLLYYAVKKDRLLPLD